MRREEGTLGVEREGVIKMSHNINSITKGLEDTMSHNHHFIGMVGYNRF